MKKITAILLFILLINILTVSAYDGEDCGPWVLEEQACQHPENCDPGETCKSELYSPPVGDDYYVCRCRQASQAPEFSTYGIIAAVVIIAVLAYLIIRKKKK